jgi:3-dehydroquinate synthase
LSDIESNRILDLLIKLGFELSHPIMQISESNSAILSGLEEFREHLGGELTIMLLDGIGSGFEVHQIDNEILINAAENLKAHYH